MKLLVVSNSLNTAPKTYRDATDFRCHFNRVVELPAFCEMCIGSYECTDATAGGQLALVNLLNLPIDEAVGNCEKGRTSAVIGTMQTTVNLGEPRSQNWISFENPAPIQLTFLDVSLTDADGVSCSGFSNETIMTLYYRSAK